MSRKSARILGQSLGMNAHEVNEALEHLGYIEKSKYVTMNGSPTWDLTEEGKKHGETSKNPYSNGAIWDDNVMDDVSKLTGRKAFVDWYCDGCGAYLNLQVGFVSTKDRWVCTKCGYDNDITDANIV